MGKGEGDEYYLCAKPYHMRSFDQNHHVSTLLYCANSFDIGIADEQLRKRLLEIPPAFLEFETGLSRHTIVRARRGEPVHARSLQSLKNVVRRVPLRK
jgi:hypothetical protein